MALQSQEIKNLIQGISQQPDWLRFPSQAETQINAFSSESDGLLKRPPTVLKKRLGDSDLFSNDPIIHLDNRDSTEQYYIMLDGSTIKIYDLDGNEKTLNSSDYISYVTTTKPRDDLRLLTVADYTFIVNKTVTIEQSSNYTDTMDWDHTALISVRGGQYGRTLKIGINGEWTTGLTLPDGSSTSDIEKMDTGYIIDQLISQLKTTFPTYSFSSGEGYIEITAPSGTTINKVQSIDGYNNELLRVVWSSVSSATYLPLQAPDGYIVEITGVTNNSEDDYFVKYNSTKRIWQECAGSNVNQGFSESTMPHVLIRESDGTFTFKPFTWGIRKAGDEDTNPDPSFVGSTINNIFFYSNRLGFLSGENVIMSRAAQYEDFYVASVAAISDDDMIDIASSDSRINILKWAIPFNEMLLLISNDTQFVLSKTSGILTTKTVSLDLATNFPCSDYSHPMAIGRGVYFCTPRSEYSQINRYYAVLDASNGNDAQTINSHCPNYIENGIFEISGSATENFITLLTEGAKNRIYMYKFLYDQDSVKQQSWSHWEFPSDFEVLTAQCINSKMYLVLKTSAGIFLETVDFTLNLEDLENEPYRIYLDGKTTYTVPSGLYDGYTNRTTLTVKDFYGSIGWDCNLKLVSQNGRVYECDRPDVGWTDSTTVSLYGDFTGDVFIVGRVFKMSYEFSKLLIKQTADDGSVSTVTNGRFQLKKVALSYKNTGAYDVSVVSGTRTSNYTFSAIRSSQADIGAVNNILQNGQYRFPVQGNAAITTITVTSDYPTPVSLVSCYFEGNYQSRSQGL
ncbi:MULTISPECIES: hypothetical protein [unclassified Tatumella]|uniref:phage nozzle protein n=1 Tax=unclassified Tatumella TaxID=2649542 RepID=UPI001BAE788A|nr:MULTISPECIES: hypothetical protein [unclassified Tatumella]MBS0878861.1 hypothetical protein [Tatumella sp. JGM82]MBS0892370.1 hypothetical protein [Tatumella sp. JGM94]MBS0903459.1 hypothetical protein [Tatumella sp. JGM100]